MDALQEGLFFKSLITRLLQLLYALNGQYMGLSKKYSVFGARFKYLIPGHYLKLAASKERDIDRKADILQKAQKLLSIVDSLNVPGGACSDCKIEQLEKAARDCAQLFQRSSSCVEGRNAQLALRHQGIHRLSDRQLKAATVDNLSSNVSTSV